MTCSVCGGTLPEQRGPRARRYCTRACQAKAYRARQQQRDAHRIPPGEEQHLVAEYATVPARQLADSLSLAAGRIAGALTAGQPADGYDLGILARVPVVLAARAHQTSALAAALPSPETAPDSPTVTVLDLSTRPERPGPAAPPAARQSRPARATRDDLPAKAPARRRRLTQKAARAVADSAQLVKDPGHRDTQRWNLVAENGTVLGHVVPSYGGTGRTGRNGWKYRDAESFVSGGPYKTRQEAAVQCALSWIRAATAPARRP